MIEKGFISKVEYEKHLAGDWRTVHNLWRHIRNYMTTYPAPGATTYTKTEVDAFFEGYSGGKAQVDAGNVVGLTQGSIPVADASGFLTEYNSVLFWDAGNVRLALGHASPQTILHILTATSSEIRIETSGASDPTQRYKTTNTAHEIYTFMDESAVNDILMTKGVTAGVATQIHFHSVDGQQLDIRLYSGEANYGVLRFTAADDLILRNTVEDKDLKFTVNDGGVAKTITWDAANDKLKHSGGTFNFDDDNIVTTGTLGCGVLTSGNIIIPDAGNIGSVSDTDAIAIAAGGEVTLSQALNLASGQIIFPGAQSASANANTLDDYEEGTWTPLITFGTNSANQTYSLQAGYYTKIGNRILFEGIAAFTNKGTSVGSARIEGLPFTAANILGYAPSVNHRIYNLTFANQTQTYIRQAEKRVDIMEVTEAGTETNLNDTDFTNTSFVNISGNYRI